MRVFESLKCAALVSFLAGSATAATLPYGPMNDVSSNTVSEWGYSECFTATYSSSQGTSITDEIAGCSISATDYIILAGRRTGSEIFDVLAATTVGFLTGLDTGADNNGVTVSDNGAEWYNADTWSVGFAGLGDIVGKSTCDARGKTERDRLCWHLRDSDVGGYRSGDNRGLNDSLDWEKVILVASPHPVPVPAAGFLLIGGLGGFVFLRRRNKGTSQK